MGCCYWGAAWLTPGGLVLFSIFLIRHRIKNLYSSFIIFWDLPMIEDDIYIFEWWVTEHLEHQLDNSCSNWTMYTWSRFWMKKWAVKMRGCEKKLWPSPTMFMKKVSDMRIVMQRVSFSPESGGVWKPKITWEEKVFSWIMPGKNRRKKLRFYLKYWHWPCWLSAHKVLWGCWSSR